jgi:hypothetical protein
VHCSSMSSMPKESNVPQLHHLINRLCVCVCVCVCGCVCVVMVMVMVMISPFIVLAKNSTVEEGQNGFLKRGKV